MCIIVDIIDLEIEVGSGCKVLILEVQVRHGYFENR